MSQDRQGLGAQDASASSTRPPRQESARLELTRDLGWLLTMVSALGALVGGSWMRFPQDSVGMWASYWVTVCATIAILGCIFLRASLPTALGVAVTAAAGGVLLLAGVLHDYPTSISVTMIAGGAGIVIGALMQGVRHAGS